MKINNKNFYSIEIILGLGLGLGYLTSLRFLGPVGVPEILTLIALIILIIKNSESLVKNYSKKEFLFKIYILSATFIVMPVTTAVVYYFADYIVGSAPQYIISFMMGVLLMFYLASAIQKKIINMRVVSFVFLISFILTNLVAIYLFGIEVGADEGARYTGGAKNPNQLVFYAATLSLLLVVYLKKLSFIAIPIIAFIVLKGKSDAYILMLFVVIFSYVFFGIFFANKVNFKKNIFFAFLFALISFIYIILNFSEDILNIWLSADEGDSRTSLMINAIEAIFYSPLFGFGAGSFSGLVKPFEGSEAHNTFLDFMVQFGLIYPLVLYWFVFKALLVSLERREILASSFIMGFIVSGLFHFSARHFVFWVELAILYGYVFYSDVNLKNVKIKCSV